MEIARQIMTDTMVNVESAVDENKFTKTVVFPPATKQKSTVPIDKQKLKFLLLNTTADYADCEEQYFKACQQIKKRKRKIGAYAADMWAWFRINDIHYGFIPERGGNDNF